MDWTEKRIQEQLSGLRVLVVEDDCDLAPRLDQLFRTYGAREVIIRRCVHGLVHGGLDMLRRQGDKFDLLCVDVMLPLDEESLRTCDHLRRERDQLERELVRLRIQKTAKIRMTEIREKRDEVSDRIPRTIDRDAGVKMVREWWDEMNRKCSAPWAPPMPILFLSARQDTALWGEVTRIAQNAKWVMKPALELEVVTAVAELLSQLGARRV